MALSKTHIGVYLLAGLREGKKIEELKEMIPYVVLPDAIRCFQFTYKGELVKNNRVVSHFEVHPQTGCASGMTFPSKEEIRVLNADVVSSHPMNVEPDYGQVAIGDDTSIDEFRFFNEGIIDPDVYQGCLIHLTQDCIYDEYVRTIIDCSQRRISGKFFFDGVEYDAKSVRTLISEIEECEFRELQQMLVEEFDFTLDEDFFINNVKQTFDEAYCPFMAEKTFGFIKLGNDNVPQHISAEQARAICNRMAEETRKIL